MGEIAATGIYKTAWMPHCGAPYLERWTFSGIGIREGDEKITFSIFRLSGEIAGRRISAALENGYAPADRADFLRRPFAGCRMQNLMNAAREKGSLFGKGEGWLLKCFIRRI